MAEPLWTPSKARVGATNMTRFLAAAAALEPRIVDYETLYDWSIAQPAAFWRLLWDFCGVRAAAVGDRVVDDVTQMPGARFFPEARLNFAENLLRFRDDRIALSAWNENGPWHGLGAALGRAPGHTLTYAALTQEVARLAAAMRDLGIKSGDRVAGFLPNLPQAVIAMLATASFGAIWSSCSPDFGARGVLDRFGQIRPRLLFCADGYFFGGKSHDSLARIAEVAAALPELERIVVVPYRDRAPDLSFSAKAILWTDFAAAPAATTIFEQLPFDHPLYVMYSSGTTGLPKCLVHGAGGTLIQHLKELTLHTDLKRDDRIFYFTTCGWMMWNWLVSSLAVGATVLLFDGSPLKPDPEMLWRMVAEERVTIFGTSAKYLALAEKEGLRPAITHDVSSLRTVLSTGSPLLPENFDFVYREIGADVQLSSISGGTDIISCFALGNPIAPVFRGELQARGLGMKVEIFDDAGRSLVGAAGELVCTQAFPSMPIGFWNDPENAKYHAAYFDFFPGIWRHGDWAELTPRGGLIIHGRSDATLNRGGVRIGTAEIYRQVETVDEVVESLVVGQDWDHDVRIVLFVRLRPGQLLDQALTDKIVQRIRRDTSPHHVPQKILAVADLPRTLSGKLSELAVRDVIHGRVVKNSDALANPEALELFRNLPELMS